MIFLQLQVWGTSACLTYFGYFLTPLTMVGEGLIISCHKKAASCGRESKNSTTLPQRIVLSSILACVCVVGRWYVLKLTFICTSFDDSTMWLLKCVFSTVQISFRKARSVFCLVLCLRSLTVDKYGKL